MERLTNYRERLKAIEVLVDKMENGLLSIGELSELERLTRELHERSIILKYKAFESSDSDRQIDEKPKVEEKPIPNEPKEEIKVEITPKEEESKEEEAVLDFSLFDSDDEEKEEPVKETEAKVEKIEAEPKIEDSTIKEEKASDSDKKEEKDTPAVVVKEKGTSFLDRLNIADNSVDTHFGGGKITTLSGAFGINERLLYINDLFDGSGDDFSDAVKALDSQKSLDEASQKIEELAFKNSWDPEQESVLGFLSIIKRRYA